MRDRSGSLLGESLKNLTFLRNISLKVLKFLVEQNSCFQTSPKSVFSSEPKIQMAFLNLFVAMFLKKCRLNFRDISTATLFKKDLCF